MDYRNGGQGGATTTAVVHGNDVSVGNAHGRLRNKPSINLDMARA